MIIFFRWRCTVSRYVWSIPILRWQYFVHIYYALFFSDWHFSHLQIILGAMKNNTHLLKQGALVLLPELDDVGRSIIYANPSLRGEGCLEVSIVIYACCCFTSSRITFLFVCISNNLQFIQLWWYLVHVAMERPSCRKVSRSFLWWHIEYVLWLILSSTTIKSIQLNLEWFRSCIRCPRR